MMFWRKIIPADPHERARERMIERQLRRRGIVMHRVLQAFRAVPRHLFIAREYSHRAYADEALPSREGQTISQPYIVAVMTQELQVRPGMRILELGTGTGYQTALLAHLVGVQGRVFPIERVEALGQSARRRLEAMQIANVEYRIGDGSLGWPPGESRPVFDRILITAAAPQVPAPVLDQLAEGGILVAPLGGSEGQVLTRIVRRGEAFEQTPLLRCRFVPLLGTHAWQPPQPHAGVDETDEEP